MTSVEEYLGVRDEKKRAKWIIGTGSVSLERIKGGRNEFFPTQIFRDLYRIVNEIQSRVCNTIFVNFQEETENIRAR